MTRAQRIWDLLVAYSSMTSTELAERLSDTPSSVRSVCRGLERRHFIRAKGFLHPERRTHKEPIWQIYEGASRPVKGDSKVGRPVKAPPIDEPTYVTFEPQKVVRVVGTIEFDVVGPLY